MTHDSHSAAQAAVYQRGAVSHDDEVRVKSRTYRRKAEVLVSKILQSSYIDSLTALEIGCGTGILTDLLARRLPRNVQITATDTHEGVLQIAKHRLASHSNVTITRMDACERSPILFDVVYGCDLIHHLEDPISALKNWLGMTRPAARLFFLESNPKNPVLALRSWNRPEEKRLFLNSTKNLESWAQEAGWEDVKVSYLPFYLPNLTPTMARWLDCAEDLLHITLPPVRIFSGLMLLEASRG